MVAPSRQSALLVRADAGAQIGTGHVMRCLALAQAWQDAGGPVMFAMAAEVPALSQRLAAEGMGVTHIEAIAGNVADAQHTLDRAQALGAVWVVVDGYHFDGDYQRRLQAAGLKVLCVDDNGGAEHYFADVILNQNLHADAAWYTACEPSTQLLLGPRYALLRREFMPWREWRREVPETARKVLVTLGGSDPENVTLQVVQGLQLLPARDFEAVVVVGAGNPHYSALGRAAQAARFPIRLERNAAHMPDLMTWAEVAVSAAGSTCWELARMGVPTVALVCADNQRRLAEGLEAAGVVLNLGWHAHVTPAHIAEALSELSGSASRAAMASKGQAVVDGLGPLRVVRHMTERHSLSLRPVVVADRRLVWEWANEPEVRAVSFAKQPIPWEQHVQWFASKLADPGCLFYIAHDQAQQPVGQIRYEVQGAEAVVSLSVKRQARGHGYGSRMIQLGSRQAFESAPIRAIHAYVLPDNEASLRAFLKAGFKRQALTRLGEVEAQHLVLERDICNG